MVTVESRMPALDPELSIKTDDQVTILAGAIHRALAHDRQGANSNRVDDPRASPKTLRSRESTNDEATKAGTLNELRESLEARNKARQARADLLGRLAELKVELKESTAEIDKLTSTVEAIEREVLTGATGLDLIDAARRNGHCDDDRPGDRGPTDFHGRRQPTPKPKRDRPDERRAGAFPAFDLSTDDGAEALGDHLASIEREVDGEIVPVVDKASGPSMSRRRGPKPSGRSGGRRDARRKAKQRGESTFVPQRRQSPRQGRSHRNRRRKKSTPSCSTLSTSTDGGCGRRSCTTERATWRSPAASRESGRDTGRRFTEPAESGGRWGHTTQGGSQPMFWLGAFKGVGHQAMFWGSASLIR